MRAVSVAPLLVAIVLGASRTAVSQDRPAAEVSHDPHVRITSPLGRTGLVGRVRIVAQIPPSPEIELPVQVRFFVDGTLVGSVADGPPYSVDWIDENPFERREIVAEAVDAAGHVFRDSVVLPPFEITDRTEVASILLEAGVYDKMGRFAPDLEPSSFVVRENEVVQSIDLISRETLPTTMVLLVDNSQSMARRMPVVRDAAERFAKALRENDQVIVVPFNAHVGAITGPTHDLATVGGAIAAMKAGGGTAILDALTESVHLLEGQQGRRAIVLLTDGYDENSSTDLDSVVTQAQAAQVTIYPVGISGIAGIAVKNETILGPLAKGTGGRMFFSPATSELSNIAQAVALDAHSRYLITYTPENQKKDGTWRAIRVEVPDDYLVRTRVGYRAPSPPPTRPTIEFTARNSSRQSVDVTLDDLEVIEDGVMQTIDTFHEAVDPVALVMALDSSGSMKNSADAVRQTAREFVTALRPEDSLALITFADQPIFGHVLATNRQWTLDAIDKYSANGGTALYDALWDSLLHLKSAPGRRAIVLLTDGRDENNPGTAPGSIHTLDEVLELRRQLGAVVFPIGLGTNVDRAVLDRLAAESGGGAYYSPDPTVLSQQFRSIIEDLRRRYVLSYTSTNTKRDGAWRKVEIRPRTAGLVVATQGGYFAPSE